MTKKRDRITRASDGAMFAMESRERDPSGYDRALEATVAALAQPAESGADIAQMPRNPLTKVVDGELVRLVPEHELKLIDAPREQSASSDEEAARELFQEKLATIADDDRCIALIAADRAQARAENDRIRARLDVAVAALRRIGANELRTDHRSVPYVDEGWVAPQEGAECVKIARAALAEIDAGKPKV